MLTSQTASKSGGSTAAVSGQSHVLCLAALLWAHAHSAAVATKVWPSRSRPELHCSTMASRLQQAAGQSHLDGRAPRRELHIQHPCQIPLVRPIPNVSPVIHSCTPQPSHISMLGSARHQQATARDTQPGLSNEGPPFWARTQLAAGTGAGPDGFGGSVQGSGSPMRGSALREVDTASTISLRGTSLAGLDWNTSRRPLTASLTWASLSAST